MLQRATYILTGTQRVIFSAPESLEPFVPVLSRTWTVEENGPVELHDPNDFDLNTPGVFTREGEYCAVWVREDAVSSPEVVQLTLSGTRQPEGGDVEDYEDVMWILVIPAEDVTVPLNAYELYFLPEAQVDEIVAGEPRKKALSKSKVFSDEV